MELNTNTNGNGNSSRESSKEKNIYLEREKCFLCHCSNPNPSKNSDDESDEGNCGDECNSPANDDSASRSSTNSEINRLFGFKPSKKLTKMPLWMCNECKKNCEEEEKQNKILKILGKSISSNLDFFDKKVPAVMPDRNSSSPARDSGDETRDNDLLKCDECICHNCLDRRIIEEQDEKQNVNFQTNWIELRDLVKKVYRDSEAELSNIYSKGYYENFQEIVRRLILYEAHKLYLKLQDEVKEHLNEVKSNLLKQLRSSMKAHLDALEFITVLLHEYDNLCQASKMLSSILRHLEDEHLKRFHVTWELENKNLFRVIIYQNELIQSAIPNLILLLRENVTESPLKKKASTSECAKTAAIAAAYPCVFQKFHNFSEEMNVVAAVWKECQFLINKYETEQESLFTIKQEIFGKDPKRTYSYKSYRQMLKDQFHTNSEHISDLICDTPWEEFLKPFKLGKGETKDEENIEESGEEPNTDSNGDLTADRCDNCDNANCSDCAIRKLIICGILDNEAIEKQINDEIEAPMNSKSPTPPPQPPLDSKSVITSEEEPREDDFTYNIGLRGFSSVKELKKVLSKNLRSYKMRKEQIKRGEKCYIFDDDEDRSTCENSDADEMDDDSDDDSALNFDDANFDKEEFQNFFCKNLFNLHFQIKPSKEDEKSGSGDSCKQSEPAGGENAKVKFNKTKTSMMTELTLNKDDFAKLNELTNALYKSIKEDSVIKKTITVSTNGEISSATSTKTTTTTTSSSGVKKSVESKSESFSVRKNIESKVLVTDAEQKGHKRKLLSTDKSLITSQRIKEKARSEEPESHLCPGGCGHSHSGRKHAHHYHIIESNVKEEKKYLKSDEDIHEAIKEYRSALIPDEDENAAASGAPNCCCGMIGGTSADRSGSKNFNCHCYTSTIAAVATTSHNLTPQNKSIIEIRERLRKKCVKKKEIIEAATQMDSKLKEPENNSSSSSHANTFEDVSIDELVKYINGEIKDVQSEPKKSKKASSIGHSNRNNSIVSMETQVSLAESAMTKKQLKKLKKKQTKAEKSLTSSTTKADSQSEHDNDSNDNDDEQMQISEPPPPLSLPKEQMWKDKPKVEKEAPKALNQLKKAKKSKNGTVESLANTEVETQISENGNSHNDNAKVRVGSNEIKCVGSSKKPQRDRRNSEEAAKKENKPIEKPKLKNEIISDSKNSNESISDAPLNIYEVFLPRNDIENLNESDKELEEFKRFCWECRPIQHRQKLCIDPNGIRSILQANKMKINGFN